MEPFQSICILGRQPALGTAELERLCGANRIKPHGMSSCLVRGRLKTSVLERLGGTMKIGRVLTEVPTSKWESLERYLQQTVVQYADMLPEGKLTFGLSAYGFPVNGRRIGKTTLDLKKLLREHGRSVRVVPNTEPVLSSAQIIHNRLTSKNAWELLAVSDGKRTILAQTTAVQDIEAYAARDQQRPHRDARVGMLPPKLAQIIINLGAPKQDATILDPFCGTGVLLQEALLMGRNAYGTDIDERMVRYSRDNLEGWLLPQLATQPALTLEQADATTYQWKNSFDCVAAETFLGPPMNRTPSMSEFQPVRSKVDSLLRTFLKNIGNQIQSGTNLSLAMPAWATQNGTFNHLPLLDHLSDMGYNRVSFVHVRNAELIYYRQGQTVARELVVLEKI